VSAEAREPWWARAPRVRWVGGNQVRLLEGGDALFPAMQAALAAARHEVWFATYIFHDDRSARAMADALAAAARRGVLVHLVVDGFGSMATLPTLRDWLSDSGVRLEVFRPIDRWWNWLQPQQLRRLHQKLCVVDEAVAFVGGINVIDDRNDLNHGWSDVPRLDFAVEVTGPLAGHVRHVARAMWARAHLGRGWRREAERLLNSPTPVDRTLRLLRTLGAQPRGPLPPRDTTPMRAAFVVRDNVGQRRAIERRFIDAMRQARTRIDIAVPYFYPGGRFRRTLREAAGRGVQVRLLLQGKVDYPFAALAARALYDELRGHGVRIFEYTPAFLHAKVALVDDTWATVGSSNIDPLSLLLNLEANVIVRDADFNATLAARLEAAFAVATEITQEQPIAGWRRWLRRGLVAWVANAYLRLAGVTGRY
jgi:cardiolipin synthase A/B